ncbi:50S ribosomal protein L24 [Patescibacteria group bacterium]|nr:50S ribosomal protein L24 [Patescibacteria group bacterium]
MKVKKGDNVLVISGKDRGKKGKITQVLLSNNKVIVEGVNKTYRHVKPKREGEKGQKIEFFAPVSVSNVILVCPKCNQPARIGRKLGKDNKTKQRICRKCQEAVD